MLYFKNRARLKAKAAAAAAAQSAPASSTGANITSETLQPQQSKTEKSNSAKKSNADDEYPENGLSKTVSEEFARQPFKNPDISLKEAMSLITQEDW